MRNKAIQYLEGLQADEELSSRDCATLLGLSPSTLTRRRQSGSSVLPYRVEQLGRTRRVWYRAGDILALLRGDEHADAASELREQGATVRSMSELDVARLTGEPSEPSEKPWKRFGSRPRRLRKGAADDS